MFARIVRRAQGEELDETFLVNTAVSLVLAGQDTMCSALTWFFWLVSTNQNVEKEIVREIKHNDGLLREMVYTHASIYESMRLFPPIPLDSKEAVEDDVCPDGTKVKKGTSIIYHIFAMGRSQELWSSDWVDFRLERWLERRRSGTWNGDDWNFITRDPFTYPVFQAVDAVHWENPKIQQTFKELM
ncbi:Cytochrome 94A1 [Capsicum chinense]|nr:Cytochrome 94A1 [Capsicum chinense]